MDFVHMSLQDGVGDECHVTASAGVLLLLHHISSSSISLGYLQSPSGHLEEEVREAGDGKTQDDLIFKESALRADSFYKSKCTYMCLLYDIQTSLATKGGPVIVTEET